MARLATSPIWDAAAVEAWCGRSRANKSRDLITRFRIRNPPQGVTSIGTG